MHDFLLPIPNHAGWPLVPLGDMSELIARGTAPSYVTSSDVLAVGQRCVTPAGFDPSFARPHRGQVSGNVLTPRHNDVLVNSTGTGTIGRTCVFEASGQFIVDSHVTVIRPRRGVADGRWIEALIRSPRGQLFLASACYFGSTNQVELSGTRLARAMVPLPPIEDQRRVAEILGSVDEAIRSAERLVAKLEHARLALLRDLLARGVHDNGKTHCRIGGRRACTETPLGPLPPTWDVRPIGALLAPVDPALRSGPFGSELLKSELAAEGIPLLGIDNVHTERFVRRFTRFVPEGKYRELSRYAVRSRDVMITVMGTVGRCCVVPDDIGPALSSKHVWTLTLDEGKYLPELLCFQVNHCDWVLRHFARDTQGGTMAAIRSETLRTALVPVPPIDEQRTMIDLSTSVGARLAAAGGELAKLREMKKGLTDDLLTGRVRGAEAEATFPV